MKDLKSDKVLNYLDAMRSRRRKELSKKNYRDGLRYSEDVHNILHFLWLCGSIDYKEFKTLETRYRVRGKDMRKYVYCADIIDDEMKGEAVYVES